MTDDFPPGAERYYDVEAARRFLATPVAEGRTRWRCTLCGYPQGDFESQYEHIRDYLCSGCGQAGVRPIEEYVYP